MLVNSEVAEGDVGEVLPVFAKNFSLLILTGALIGLASFIWDSRSVFPFLALESLGSDQLPLRSGQAQTGEDRE